MIYPKKEWRPLIDRNLPLIGSTPLCQGITWSPSWKALPSQKVDGRKIVSSILTTFQVELYWSIHFGLGFSPIPWSGYPVWSDFINQVSFVIHLKK